MSQTPDVQFCSAYVTDNNHTTARKSIEALATIAQRIPAKANTCVDRLLSLLTLQVDHITAETLVALTSKLHPLNSHKYDS